METNNKAIGYIRVSTNEQTNSVEVQKTRIQEYCIFQKLTLTEIIIDQDVSGFREFNKRPGGKIASTILKSPEIKTIVAAKHDRLFRNLEDALITTAQWNKQSVDLHIIDMGGASVTTKTANGKLIFSMLIAISQFERDVTGERTKAVLDSKRSKGKTYSRPILGFDNIGNPKNKTMVPNPLEQEIIFTIKSLANTHNENRIARILNNTGFRSKTNKRFSRNTIQYILRNPIYS